MRKGILITATVVGLLSLSAISCNKDKNTGNGNSNSDNFDRGAMLTNYADNYMLPAYTDMESKLITLKTKTDEFVATPTVGLLVAVRTAWKEAYLTWERTEVLEFGPESSISLRDFMNIYPVSVTKVNNNLASGSYDLDQFGNKDAQGFPALDYLLNGVAATDSAITAMYTTEANASARKQYLQAVTAKMLSKISTVKGDWGTYKATFTNSTSTSAGSSMSLMTNAYILYYERYVRAGKIGLPVGAMSGVAAPELTEAYYTPTLSKELVIEAMNSVISFYEGKGYSNGIDGLGFKDYMTAVATKDNSGLLMAEVISREMAQIATALAAMPSTVRSAVTTNRTDMLKVYEEMQQLVPLIKVDMVSAFGISITYTDNDGD